MGSTAIPPLEAGTARAKDGDTFTVTRYPGQVRGLISNAKLLPKAYDAIEDSRGRLRANQ
jgi:hypothetical protein